jgi:hypothetical protein
MPAARNRLPPTRSFIMGLLLLEALAALGVLVLIVWWTMFSGRRDGERRGADIDEGSDKGSDHADGPDAPGR